MKVIFMGSSEFSVATLIALLNFQCKILAVYTKAPKPAGRGKNIRKTPVHIVAERHNIDIYTPSSLRSDSEIEKIRNMKPDVIVVVAYGLILPKRLLDIPKYECINVHPSLLPRWRGAAPMQHTILYGDSVTGVTIIKVGELLDAGDILLQKKVSVNSEDNINTLSDRLSFIGSELVVNVLNNINSILPTRQSDVGVTYANKLTDFKINFYDSAEFICRKIRACYPKAFFVLHGKRIRILKADSYEFNQFNAGDIINDNMHIKCGGNTVLVPMILQMEGKNACNINNFLRGYRKNILGSLL
ncbi:methionyl-tRNA formyltransferase [Neoehrlichia mikurensis]|uniref:Methionyl-tRNA formyltransferase n=1 Tax=Neoehrlichia mikurensis TaxID=89586 RepID=A0A9Q9BU37_9RICK|nr:methionyl-tRNA formyltransferase [Neoehrlichia mikurensis]QXK92133.1 methionyl-tRNA formyltransferase [Neoehrlichia mikurensis]QXK92590.1 methionyl-tRNA formyltransferase [Neoehrlichia mikurensis]QXK93827.1 methionyl-tRNA formyltransferase [Neoehrlichia mikurensis]UTO55178.1 methionyl-tRNA formyltransferase [Neoehrlichia mikurensis]UTO56098.1 methionyl-tRNA formyltransferase [Neoehrlichia mikurensis]